MSNFFPELEGVSLGSSSCSVCVTLCFSHPPTVPRAAPLYGLIALPDIIAFDAAIPAQARWTLWNNK